MKLKHETCAALIKAIDAYIAKQDGDIEDELKDAGYLDTSETMDKVKAVEDKLAEAMNHDTAVVIDELEKSESVDKFVDNMWDRYQEASALADDIQDVVKDELTSFIPKLAAQYLASTDKSLTVSVLRQRTTDWIMSWSQELGSLMKLNSHAGIQSILSNAMSSGLSVADVTRDLMDSGIRTNYSRARSTALTEMLTAHSVSSQEAYMQSPAVEGKGWLHSGSRRNKPRKNHVAMDGQVVPKNEPFELQGADGRDYKPMYPRDTKLPPSERVNCHCIHSPVVSEDILGLSLEERKALQQQAIDDDNRQWAIELDEQNKARSGNSTFGVPVNSLLPNANGGIIKVDKVIHEHKNPLTSKPNTVLDNIHRNGGVSRCLYDDEGRLELVIDNNDHGYPTHHPFGNGGAHYARFIYDDDGNITYQGDYCLTAKMRRLCEDIVSEYADVIEKEGPRVVDLEDVRDGINNYTGELFLNYENELYIISRTISTGPHGEPLMLLGPDLEAYAWDTEGVLNLMIKGRPFRSIVQDMKWD